MTAIHQARACHPIPPPPEDEPLADFVPSSLRGDTLPRLRSRTNDPAREYAARPGEVRPLPDNVAALILCKKGWAKIERHQIKITLDGEDLYFTSRNSLLIATKNGTGERVLWTLNRRHPELLHLLTPDGRYIESLPRKGEGEWFSQDEASQEAYAAAQSHLQRDMRHLARLHQPDTAAAAADAVHNAAQVHRLVQTFPAETPSSERANTPANFPKAERLETAMREGTRQKTVARQIDPSAAARADTARILARRETQPVAEESWL